MNIYLLMYTYSNLLVEQNYLARAGAEVEFIGSTVGGRMIPCFFCGSRFGPQIIIQAGIHAREHITCQLVVEQIYYFLRRHTPRSGGGVYFVPMVNIDGITLCQFGLNSVRSAPDRNFLLYVNEQNGLDYSLWKANLNAVDLNTNFPARWGTGASNVTAPAPESYIGSNPASEPETRALMALTERVRPAATVSYHCRGQEIFWDFHQPPETLARDRQLAEGLSALTGYKLSSTGASAGGYKDWCIERFGIPAFTVEIVEGDVPFPVDYANLSGEFCRNRDVPLYLLDRL